VASVSFEKVTKSYGRSGRAAPVVFDLDLEVNDGELVSLVGPSGCGKSTTLNLIAGLEQPTRGNVRIGGAIVNGLSPKERDIAMVFQSYALYPHLRVRDNIAFPLSVARTPRAEVDRRVLDTAERLGLTPLLDRRPAELSGGQRQRVALARALVRRPKLFLFDEPLSNLDAALRLGLRGELKKLHESLAATFVYVTHDQAEAMTLSDRIAVLNGGVLQQFAPPRAIYDEPANVFVARFFGAPPINIVPASRLPPFRALEAAHGAPLLVGLRPEHLALEAPGADVAQGAAAAVDVVAGEVYLVEPMGAETWVTVDVGGERVVARAPYDADVRSGSAVRLRVERSRALLFDAAHETRVTLDVRPGVA
jgi:multiple sugar transport system ATP-binding protein